MRAVADLDVTGQVVLLRADLNVPLGTANGRNGRNGAANCDVAITDDGRIRASLPTISDLTSRGARVLICAHLGRPQGDDYAERAAGGPSLRPVAARLGELTGKDVALADDVAGPSAAGLASDLADGEIGLLENVRFEPAETARDDAERREFARRLAALATRYAGDGFGALHRKHASVYDVPALLPHAAGYLVQAEIDVLRQLTEQPERPYVVVLGGAKPSDKLAVIGNLLATADRLIIGGGMSYTFLAAKGYEVGQSLLESELIGAVREVLAEADNRGVEIVLPVDLVGATRFAPDADYDIYPVGEFPADRESLDMGPRTRALFASKLADARTVFWNGPVGVFEFPAFAAGTRAVAQAISDVAGFTVIGGGDSAAAVRQLNFPDTAFSHISTGGGASLEYLEGKTLPGLAALEDAS
ncbi:MAG TPA: phosphoglycerate kinase [Streptosporangiaceae bacterium]|nr:phosphoglycerate kinase [Streptosporangiaceae bacterium]